MINNNIKSPTKAQQLTLRIMILIGIISVANFFYWFLNPDLVDNAFLFVLLIVLLVFDAFRLLYIWYHYWKITVPKNKSGSVDFKVDVFTTYFPGEPIDMLTQTLLAIQNMNYPHTTYLCDEEDNVFLKTFCEDHNIIHVTRTNRKDAKAGNINNALKIATGDICLILDPDHVPEPRFLEEVLPYFKDDKIGFVQTVQAYYNVNESKVAKGAAQQTFHFYGPLMMGMQSYGTVNAIGANCVFRREALDSIDGHAAGLSEDMHTAMQLHAKGWKSMYLPKSYTKGLVPATLLSYYKQQLKWSRGTFELLINVYPKLFHQFSWRQKLHYGLLPFHYLSGLMFMISFLIPILSLLFSITPWHGNVLNFGLIVIPVLTCVICIRYYVQQWVIYKEERGIHILGGLLFQATWWVFLTGVVFTMIGKKVLYLPTEKSDFEVTPFKIVLPNLIVGCISILSAVIGLQLDFTPFSIVMACFALWNAFLMFYTLVFAYEKRRPFELKDFLDSKLKSKEPKQVDIIFNTATKSALFIIFIVSMFCANVLIEKEYTKRNGIPHVAVQKSSLRYLGLFCPKQDNGITNLQLVNQFESQIKRPVDIVSFYYAWQKDLNENFFKTDLDSVYNQNAIPMITWEPWVNTWGTEKHVFDLINEGYFDSYLALMANRFKALNKPIFLRFAHEFDNPFYPWYDNRPQAAEVYKAAWIKAHEIFKENEAHNVIWVWNPWKAEHVKTYFPGQDYVDWLGVDILNYGTKEQPELDYSFKQLYDSFHNEFMQLPDKPVMVSEFGALNNGLNQKEWVSDAFRSLDQEFKEVKAIVFFNSKVDDNLPADYSPNNKLNWELLGEHVKLNKSFMRSEKPKRIFEDVKGSKNISSKSKSDSVVFKEMIRGINLKKGENWNQNYHVLSRENLEQDFSKMKDLGINTIRFKENEVYNYNVLNISAKFGVNVMYGFHVPETVDFVNDSIAKSNLEHHILHTIKKYKSNKSIIAWDFQTDIQYRLLKYYTKPQLYFQQAAYVKWLKSILQKIRELDSQRPIVMSLEVNIFTKKNIEELVQQVDVIDYIGLRVEQEEYLDDLIQQLEVINLNYLISDATLATVKTLKGNNNSFFLSSYQDQHEMNKVTFAGLLDRKGRIKSDYYKFKSFLKPESVDENSHDLVVNILKPAKLTYNHSVLIYKAVIYDWDNKRYRPLTKDDQLKIEWALIKTDEYDNNLTITDIGSQEELILDIPEDYSLYKLQLSVINNDCVFTSQTTLNTPYKQ